MGFLPPFIELPEPSVTPGDLAIVDRFIPNPEVVEGRKKSCLNAGEKIASEDEIVVAQRQDVGLVCAIGGSSQAEQELRGEVSQ